MSQRMRRHVETAVVAVVASVVTAAAPTIAAQFDASNADRVDGKHAVSARASIAERTGKLVATNRLGRLPNNIIGKAPDAGRLDGLDSTEFVRSDSPIDAATLGGAPASAFQPGCADGSILGYAVVDASPEFHPVYHTLPTAHFSCRDPQGHVRARRLSAGRYRVHFGINVAGQVPCHEPVVVGTVMRDEDDFLTYTPVAEYVESIDRYRCVAEVIVLDRHGNRQDRDFTLALLGVFDTHVHG
ncbi:MAG: hypothetical protein M3245_06165 [Actinomycetota bacterium]|nr:hypothetical protein [Actinomycetota bacterium]